MYSIHVYGIRVERFWLYFRSGYIDGSVRKCYRSTEKASALQNVTVYKHAKKLGSLYGI
jgi:hypothetical protein